MNKLAFTLLICSFGLVGCGERKPEFVYIPGPAYRETVAISVSNNIVKAGEPVILHAIRNTDGFVKVRYDSLDKNADVHWWAPKPPHQESEVADNLRWTIDPPGSAIFNIDFHSDHSREVRFSKPGKYKLKAYSAVWSPPETISNEIEIEILNP